jgi:hypothetical protein
MFNDNVDILINAVVYLQTLGSFGAEETPKYVRDAAKRLDVDEYDMSKVIMLLKGKFMADIRRNKSKRKIRVNPLILKRLHAHQT